jgi:hypothetical protein
MIKKIKTVLILLCSLVLLHSCDTGDPKMYAESFSVIRSSDAGKYFSSDEGINLIPSGFDPKWGEVGDRVVVGFHYNPTNVTQSTTTMNINVETLIRIPTSRSALPATVDTVGTGKFLYDKDSNKTTEAWIAQDYLTVQFWLEYSDGSKHFFGFIEENELYRNDTLFLRMWHNAKETEKSKNSYGYMSLSLDTYMSYLNRADSAIIALKYNISNVEEQHNEKIKHVTYRRKK